MQSITVLLEVQNLFLEMEAILSLGTSFSPVLALQPAIVMGKSPIPQINKVQSYSNKCYRSLTDPLKQQKEKKSHRAWETYYNFKLSIQFSG